MRIVVFGSDIRILPCLQALAKKGHTLNVVFVHPGKKAEFQSFSSETGVKVEEPEDPNSQEVKKWFSSQPTDVMILAQYGKILKPEMIRQAKMMCMNLHAGKLPDYRGCSPLNWALINGDKTFTLTINQVVTEVDAGDILLEKKFHIAKDDTIRDLHHMAMEQFPIMILNVLDKIKKKSLSPIPQKTSRIRYFPPRFPDDGLIVWDIYTAQQIHNRIRALTEPYPGAFIYYKGRKVKLLSSQLNDFPFLGEPGRIYRKNGKGILVCASDGCLWITKAVFADGASSFLKAISCYERLATLRDGLIP